MHHRLISEQNTLEECYIVMKLIRTYDTPDGAYIAKGMLDSNGIHAEVISNAASSLFPAPYAGIGRSALYVPDDEAERAEQILIAHEE